MIYFTSDQHFDHENIIRHCNRPFKTVEEMNEFMLEQWTQKITDNDIVYFLGDLTLKNTKLWLPKLTGRIVFIRGNHDRKLADMYDYMKIKIGEYDVLLIHNPNSETAIRLKRDVTFVVHGHTHNNNVPDKKFINASVEANGYAPISIETLKLYLDTRMKWLE